MGQDARPSPPGGSADSAPRHADGRVAWQPFTFGGVAALARATSGRVVAVELVVAAVATAAILSLVASDWFPVLDQAIAALPETGRIERRRLHLPFSGSRILAENPFLAVVVEGTPAGSVSAGSDLRVELRRDQWRLCSVPGCIAMPYPADWTVELNRPELKPRWGAWQPFLLVFTALGVVAGLLGFWTLLAAVCAPVACGLAWAARRPLSWAGGWRLSSAALMPAAVLGALGVLLYASAVIDLVQWAGLLVVQGALASVYLAISPFFLPPPTPPHATPPAGPAAAAGAPPMPPPAGLGRAGNPFAPRPGRASDNPFAGGPRGPGPQDSGRDSRGNGGGAASGK